MACDPAQSATDALAAALSGPAEVSGDAGSVRQFPLPDLITAANYLAGICAAKTRHRGLRFNRLISDSPSGRRPYPLGSGGGWGYGFDRYRY